jgi:cell division protein FtsI (penicillin-binding protein 3)
MMPPRHDDGLRPAESADGGRRRDPTAVRSAASLRTGRGRLQCITLAFTIAFAVIAFRLSGLMLFGGDGDAAIGAGPEQSAGIFDRADIFDRNNNLLATNLISPSLYANARVIHDPESVADRVLAVLPELDRADLVRKLGSERAFVWIKRNLTPSQQYDVNALGIPGLGFQDEQRRLYPLGNLVAHALGFVDVDGNGIAGVEKNFDGSLKSGARRGAALTLSLDIRLQHAVRDELQNAVKLYRALGGGGIVLDARTGEVLAMVSLPDFDPNHAGEASQLARFNRITLGVYELGSVFKVFNTAMALDSGLVGLNDGYDASHPIQISRFTIRDDHPKNRWLSIPEIFIYSSNIGSAKMALDIGTERQRAFMRRIGLLDRPPLELPEIGTPLSPNPWREINTMTVAFGHGLAVTPLQVANATAAIVNGGVLRPTTLIKRDGPPPAGVRVVSKKTSDTMRRLLRMVVLEGTGKKANVPGYVVGGKTGTAEKAIAHGYASRALISTFVGVFPMTAPRYVVLLLLDEPHGNETTFGYATAGWTAAPTTARIITRIAPLLGVEAVNEDAPEVREALDITIAKGRARLASF